MKYETLRGLATFSIAMCVEVMSTLLMWICTDWMAEAIILWAMVFAGFAATLVWGLTEPKKKRKPVAKKKPVQPKCNPKDVPIFTWKGEARGWVEE